MVQKIDANDLTRSGGQKAVSQAQDKLATASAQRKAATSMTANIFSGALAQKVKAKPLQKIVPSDRAVETQSLQKLNFR